MFNTRSDLTQCAVQLLLSACMHKCATNPLGTYTRLYSQQVILLYVCNWNHLPVCHWTHQYVVMYVWITVSLYVPILTFLNTLISAVQRASNTWGRSVFKCVSPYCQTFRTNLYLTHTGICLNCIWWTHIRGRGLFGTLVVTQFDYQSPRPTLM